jgi:excisionase family DNA binding protein
MVIDRVSASSDCRLLTIKEACTALGVSRPTLTELRRQGRITFVRVGSRGVRIPATAIADFVAANVERAPDVALAAPRRRGIGGRASARVV